ncbi:hypothetical protein CDAR_109401 [Caerostris darwini]|uniref:Uncharacterized protein n=1 Tax=Caerostris darwini TaxID=1538125 RepID=A0AAV4TVF9_9ARAC|nr:hypothetical protein CDAR_109401 [Caerostris darwini]
MIHGPAIMLHHGWTPGRHFMPSGHLPPDSSKRDPQRMPGWYTLSRHHVWFSEGQKSRFSAIPETLAIPPSPTRCIIVCLSEIVLRQNVRLCPSG